MQSYISGLDENKNILYDIEKNSTDDDIRFYCSKCLKSCKSRRGVTRHSSICDGLFEEDGFFKINKDSPVNLKKLMTRFGKLSCISQDIEYPMTSKESIEKYNQTSYIFVNEARALGFLTTSKRNFSIKIKNQEKIKEKISIDDFFVIRYIQRQGLGELLFNYMLDDMEYSLKPSGDYK